MAPSQPLVDRSDFPALEQYIYLNSASISLMPTPALHAMEAYERGILHAGTVSLDEEAEVLALDGARAGVAKLVGVSAASLEPVSKQRLRIWRPRMDRVVPLALERVAAEVDGGELRIRDLEAFGVRRRVELGVHLQAAARARARARDQVDETTTKGSPSTGRGGRVRLMRQLPREVRVLVVAVA